MLAFYLSLADSEEAKDKIEEIYYQYKKLIYHIAYSKLQNRESAEDVVHDVMLAVIQNIDKLQNRNGEEIKAFLYLVARNRSVDVLRKERRFRTENIDDLTLSGGVDPQDQVDARSITDCIAKMPPLYRDILELTAYYGLTAKESAALLKISASTARKRLERARILLQEQLKEVEVNVG